MKVVILAGGYGTRISEESHLKPKPMIEIGGKPILWHIMKYYSHFGHNEFIICLGYKGYVIKEFFADYYLHTSDITFDFKNHNCMEVHNNYSEPWKVTLIDTGLETMTGGRIKRVQSYVGDETFMMTYGDGVSDIDLHALLEFHKKNGKLATMSAIQPKGRFGILDIGDANQISSFREKPQWDDDWINGGFMVLEPQVFDYIEGDCTVFEKEPLEGLSGKGQLYAYQHKGFWQCMDTQRDKNLLESLIEQKTAPWMVW
jgi:glucose-1-phosphate cytidylyltransferase